MKKKAIFVCALLLAIQSYTFGAPVVPGFTVQTYANVADVSQMAFDSEGVLYVSHYDASYTQGFNIRRIGVNGTSVNNYGNSGFVDADAIAMDADGQISGTPGTLIVGCGYPSHIYGIKPDESVVSLFENVGSNPTQMRFDSTGRLLIVDPTSSAVFQISGGNSTMLFSTPAPSYSIAVDAENRIFTSDDVGTIRVYENNVLSEFASLDSSNGLTHYNLMMAFNSGNGLWNAGLYVLNDGTGNLSRFDSLGNQTILGTGFNLWTTDMTFGPDGALYIANTNGEILRIVPEPATLLLLGLGGFALLRKNKH